MSLFSQLKYITSRRRFYQVIAPLMFSGAAITYLTLRFSGSHPSLQLSSLVEISGVMFALAMMCSYVLVKCSLDLNQTSSSATVAGDKLEYIKKQQSGLMTLTVSEAVAEGNLLGAAQETTEILSSVLLVERASVWLLDDSGGSISCLDLYCRSSKEHSTLDPIDCSDYPEYFLSLNESRTISVLDALTDEITREIRDGYLAPWDIHSTVDSSIRVAGKVVGYVFVGSVSERRVWSADEVSFVAAVADQFAHAVANEEKQKTYETLKKVMLSTSSVAGESFFDSLVC